MKAKTVLLDGALQDGMLAYYLEQAKLSDANVEARIEREPFDFRNHTIDSFNARKIEKSEPRPPIFPAEWLANHQTGDSDNEHS